MTSPPCLHALYSNTEYRYGRKSGDGDLRGATARRQPRTYDEVRRQLLRGGVYRYLGDTFYGGGEWLILTAWLGWHEVRTGLREQALTRLDWIAAQATPDGNLPEQISGDVQQPSYIAEWTERWGPVATPLLWSHAMFLTLAVECGVWPC